MSKTRISEHLANNSTEFIRVATLEELKAAGKIVIRGTRCPLVVVYDHGKVLLSIIAVRILASCYDGIVAFSQTDFTEDLKNITVPVLVMHSEDDQIVPYANAGPLSAKLLKNGTRETYKNYPHGMITTHADRIDADLLTRVFCVRSTELRIGDAVNFITILEFRDAQPHGFNDA